MVPRTGPLSASSALAMTSWYQRGKSSDWGVSTVLGMRPILRSAGHGAPWHFLGRGRPWPAATASAALHRRDHERLPRLAGVRELARAAGLFEDACCRVPGHVVEVAGDLDVGATPDVAAHRLHGLHLRVGAADEARLLGPEAPDVDVDVVAVRGIEEIGEHVRELVVQTGSGTPVEGEATPKLGGGGVAPLVVPQRREVAPVGAQPGDVDGLPRAVPRRGGPTHPRTVGP